MRGFFIFLFIISKVYASDSSDCLGEVQALFSEMRPAFIDLQTKITLYKTAWTTLALNKGSGEKFLQLEKEISTLTKNLDHSEFKEEYKKFQNFKPFVDKWDSIFPEAMGALVDLVPTETFKNRVHFSKEKIDKFAVDQDSKKTAALLQILYKKDNSKNNYLLKLTNLINSSLRGRDAFHESDRKIFESIIEAKEALLIGKQSEFLAKLKSLCASEEEALETLSCLVNIPYENLIKDLDKIFKNGEVIDFFFKDAKVSDVKKEYLRVATKHVKPQTNVEKTKVISEPQKENETTYSITLDSLPNPKRTWTKYIPVIGKKEIEINTPTARDFLESLQAEKKNLMKLYNLTSEDYDKLVRLAFGILGNESYFGNTSFHRRVKEIVPAIVPIAKEVKEYKVWDAFKDSYKIFKNSSKYNTRLFPGSGVIAIVPGANEAVKNGEIDISENSRGLIQMKKVPSKIEEEYGISKEDLLSPKKAAIAAIGFLAEAKEELNGKAKIYNEKIKNKEGFQKIDESNWDKYIHYIYMGSSRELLQGTATPEKNLYYQDILHWNQALTVE